VQGESGNRAEKTGAQYYQAFKGPRERSLWLENIADVQNVSNLNKKLMMAIKGESPVRNFQVRKQKRPSKETGPFWEYGWTPNGTGGSEKKWERKPHQRRMGSCAGSG